MLPLFEKYLRRSASRLQRIALVGGPKGGKSTLVMHLQLRYGSRMGLLSETATGLFTSGLIAPPHNTPNLTDWLIDFQQVVLAVQAFRELQFEEGSAGSPVEILVHDRGSADLAAYLPGGEAMLVDLLPGITLEKLYERYDLVIHLESLATADPVRFDTKGNETRYETLEQAQEREYAARRAWERHPNYHFVSGVGGIESVIARALGIIRPYFDQEIERRWLMAGVPGFKLGAGLPIIQGYLTETGKEVRLRKEGDSHCTLSGKSELAVKRWEENVDISPDLFDATWPLVGTRVLSKVRHLLDIEGGPYELDIHLPPHEGLVTIEKTFRTEGEAEAFVLPALFGNLREVTLEPAYRSWSLACQGCLPAA